MEDIIIKKWKRDEIKELIELYPTTDTEILMEKFGRTRSAITCKAQKLVLRKTDFYQVRRGKEVHENFDGVRNKARKWTKEELNQMLLDYPHMDNQALSKKYNRTRRSINAVAQKNKVFKTEKFKRDFAKKNSLLGVQARWGKT
jgi:hypothetical protein